MKLKINWDSRRTKHAIERMTLRGISAGEIEEAIIKGKKVRQKETALTESFLRFFSVVYDEALLKKEKIRKVYPVTVKVW